MEVQIPGFEYLEKVREGGTATTWKAEQVILHRPVYLKILHTDGSKEDAEELDRVLDTMKRVAALKLKGLVEVIDAGVQEGAFYVVTEYVAGTPLVDLLQEEKWLSERKILSIAQSIARTLDYVWGEKHLFHANIKPDTILLPKSGTAMVSDLGLARTAKIRDETTGETRVIVLGTPNYMSPEQVRGSTNLDYRTDIYSLGATLYHMATGCPPFEGSWDESTMFRHLHEQIPNPRDVRPQISIGLASLITKMMMKDFVDRQTSWAEVQADIKKVRNAKIYLQKEGSGSLSTVKPPAAERQNAASVRRRREVSPIANFINLLKWAAIIALWLYVTYDLIMF
jgi:serine/threonine-protein kinase